MFQEECFFQLLQLRYYLIWTKLALVHSHEMHALFLLSAAWQHFCEAGKKKKIHFQVKLLHTEFSSSFAFNSVWLVVNWSFFLICAKKKKRKAKPGFCGWKEKITGTWNLREEFQVLLWWLGDWTSQVFNAMIDSVIIPECPCMWNVGSWPSKTVMTLHDLFF